VAESAHQPPVLVRTRLSVMMLLQYAIWGAWLPILYPFLLNHRGMTQSEVGSILAGGAVGAIIGPFIAGQVADRYFATERYLAISHLVGAGLVWWLASVSGFWTFFSISVVYGVVYAPTLALTNSISFHHLPDRDRDFGRVRVWGTVGWIVAGIAVGQWLAFMHTPEGTPETVEAAQNAGRADAFRLSAVLGMALGLYCLTLPHTPPAREAKEANAAWEAIKEVRRQPLTTLFLLAVPISIIHQFYFVHTSQFLTEIQNRAGGSAASDAINRAFGVGGGGLMTIGQMTEIAVIALIPLVAKRWSRKSLLAIGILAYALRMALFAYTPAIHGALGVPEVVVASLGVSLHGLCFGCFIFVAFMIVDEQTTPDVRASAQNLFNLVIIGIGIIIGSWFATSIVGQWAEVPVLDEAGRAVLDAAGQPETELDYRRLFSVPLWIAVGCGVVLAVFYPRRSRHERTGDEPSDAERATDSTGPAPAPPPDER